MTRTIQATAAGTLSAAALAVSGAILTMHPAAAQDDFDVALGEWNYDQAYQGWSAEEFLDEAEVFGPDGEEIGSVENLLISDQGQIVALIAQVGGFWDIGDTHVAVPWDQATIEGYNVEIPVTEESIDDYSMFADEYFTQTDVGRLETVDDDVTTGFNIWKATDLMNDYAVLETGVGYGYVNDLIFSDGMLQSVIVNATNDYGEPGYYGYPWYGYGYEGYEWDPGLDRYVLPFDENEISELVTAFNYDELEGGIY